MNLISKSKKLLIFFSTIGLILMMLTAQAFAKNKSDWFETYDINDTETVWKMLMRPITVVDAKENSKVYLLDAPNGKRLKKDKLGGYIYGKQAGVKVLGSDENGYTLIEAYDQHDRLLQGYVKTNLLKEVTPYDKLGVVIDKLSQKLYVFQEGKLLTSLYVSTGLVTKTQPYNETASGEYLISSWVGDFWSGNMLCRKGIRFNGGDLLHYVPALVRNDGGYDYSHFKSKLGLKASHGCVRVQEEKNEQGYNMEWLWKNLKKGTKVLIWDDDGREHPYVDDYTIVYYNPEGGKYYHATANCPSVKKKFLPLKPFYYGQLRGNEAPFNKLKPCPFSDPPPLESSIDEANRQNLSPEDFEALMAKREEVHKLFDKNKGPLHDLINQAETSETKSQTVKLQSIDDSEMLIDFDADGNLILPDSPQAPIIFSNSSSDENTLEEENSEELNGEEIDNTEEYSDIN